MDVNTLTYDGRRIWPIVRWRLFGALGASQSARTLGPTHYLPDLLGQRLSSLMAATDEADVGQLVVFERVSNLLKASQTIQQLASLGTSHFLFFCRADQHYETVQGGRYSPVLDSILEACGDHGPSLKLMVGAQTGLVEGYAHRPVSVDIGPLLCRDIIDSLLAGAPLARLEEDEAVPGLSALRRVFAELEPGVDLAAANYAEEIRLIEGYRGAFAKILEQLRPRAVFLSCYYDYATMGLIAAARDRGTPTIDAQHGQQGQYHGLYTHYTTVPEGGYDHVPDWFWLWGDFYKRNIDRFAPFGTDVHRTVVGGNMWAGGWASADCLRRVPPEQRGVLEQLERFDRRVFVCLQWPIADPLPDHLVEAIRAAPEGWAWLLRPHPLMPREAFQAMAVSDVRATVFATETANRIPVHAVLRYTDYHVTTWSSTTHDALAFNVPSVFVHDNAAHTFPDLLENGAAVLALDAKSILNAIGRQPEPGRLAVMEKPIETNPALVERALETVLRTGAKGTG